MKYFLLTLTIFIPSIIFGQNTQERLEQQVCSCIMQEKFKTTDLRVIHANCFDKLLDTVDLSTLNQIKTSMINSCDAFYKFYNDIRESSLTEIRNRLIKITPEDLIVNEKSSVDQLFDIGWKHLALSNLSEAKFCFLKAYQIDPNFLQIRTFLSWVYEKEENSQEAIKLLEEEIAETGNKEVEVLLAMLERKYR